MITLLKNIPIKIKIIIPVLFGIILAISIITIFSINNSKKNIRQSVEKYLVLEVETLKNMFEREKNLKTENVVTSLKVAHDFFHSQKLEITNKTYETTATNQISQKKHQVKIKVWKLNNESLHENFSFVNKVQKLFGGTSTIFQKIDSGYIRISTNVPDNEGNRALNTYIPNQSPVAKTIEQGKTYIGRAFVVNDWYTTAYEPIYFENKIIGILYVGNKEKDLNEIKLSLENLKVGESGYPFVFDEEGNILIHPTNELKNISKETYFKEILKNKKGIVKYSKNRTNYATAYEYFEDFKLYIAATVDEDEETTSQIKNIVISSLITTIIIVLILSIFIILVTTESIKRILLKLEQKDIKIQSATQALKQSENKFKTLFDNTVDEIFVTDSNENIIEVNIAACNSLGYTREELLTMKISEIKTSKYAKHLAPNRAEIYKNGKLTYESEHITKDGEIIQVELKSRVVDYGNDKLILSISRNISDRKEYERKILSAVIQTEERERERFSKDMHDGLGPLLSTIKLYVNEINDEEISREEKQKMVNYTNELIDEAVSSTRNISNNLMPRVIHEYGLIKAVESFSNKVNSTNKINIDFHSEGINENLEQNVQLILFRVISELINNTLKHAKAKNIIIKLERIDKKIFLHFADDGVGFDVDDIMTNKRAGMGLKNIISRIRSINGNCDFYSKPDNGFKIDIEITV